MPEILDLFNQRDVLSYVNNRQYPAYLGDSLFPSRKVLSLDVEILEDRYTTPVIAPISSFDSEAQIGSREADRRYAELGYIKRKIQLKEKDLVALRNPRNPQEQQYLTQLVYNDTDHMVEGVQARVELMRMQLLANGIVLPDDADSSWKIDYDLPKEHQVTVTKSWDDPSSDPISDIKAWVNTLDIVPTRALTSRKVLQALEENSSIKALFKSLGVIPSDGSLNQIMQSLGLPVIVTYDRKYRAQSATGSYTKERFFPEDKFVMFDDNTLGETLYGPTPEESRLMSGNSNDMMVGNIFATMYEEGHDPVGTWTKAAATSLPTLASPDELFQAQVLLSGSTKSK